MFFNDWETKQENPNAVLNDKQGVNGVKQVTLLPNRYHSYVSPGTINNQPVTFIIDTGATSVAVPRNVAKSLALPFGMAVEIGTAGGTAKGYITKIETLSIGDIVLHNVKAVIIPETGEEQVLLGMSALKSLSLRQENGNLIITQDK